MDATPPTRPGSGADRGLVRGLIVLGLALAPALAAIATTREFATQDGPAHLYNARILIESLRPGSPFAGTFEVVWQPLPNWAGHLTTMALLAALPADVAGRAVTAITLIALAASIVWLRWTVSGPDGLATASILAALLAMDVTWLLGFTSFQLGAALMPATLGAWWRSRDAMGPGRALGISGLLVLGYFCHPISLGLTMLGLIVLAATTPGPARSRRGLWTAMSLVPLLPLGLAYRAMTRSGGGLDPVWEHLADPSSPQSWASQIGWCDPISLAAKVYRPFSATPSVANALLSPALWAIVALGLLAISTARGGRAGRRGWLILAGLMLVGGLIGPDTLGVKHGHYLPQRVVLLGLIALVPWLDLAAGRPSTRAASGLLALALAVQSAFVWDYSRDCRDRPGRLLKAGPAIGANRRVGTLLAGIRGRFRSNPMLHADCMLGVAADNVIWNNYETSHYYFPVKFRPGMAHPPAPEFERVALLDGPGEEAERAGRWGKLVGDHVGEMDVLVEWVAVPDPRLDAINARRYDPAFVDGPVRVWTRRDGPSKARGPE